MSRSVPPGRGSGAGVKLRVPPDIFAGANRGAAEAARNAGLDAAALAEFNDDPNLYIILRVGNVDTFQARRAGAWRDTTNIAEGQRGPGPTDQQVTNAVQTGVKPYARTGGGVVPEDEIDAAIARDSEITRTFLLSTLGLTADELNNLFVGAVVSGSGASRRLLVTRADASTLTCSCPTRRAVAAAAVPTGW